MYPNFQAKGPLPDRTLESFILKSTEGAIPGGIFKGKKRGTRERRRGKNRIYQNKTSRRGK